METHPRNLPITVEQNQVFILLEKLSQLDLLEGRFFCLGPWAYRLYLHFFFFFHHQREAINSIMLESTKSTFRSHLPHNFSSIKADFLFKARFPYLTYLYSSKKGFILFCFHDSIIYIVLSYTF